MEQIQTILEFWRGIEEGKFLNINKWLKELKWDQREIDKMEEIINEHRFREGKREKRKQKYLLADELIRFKKSSQDRDASSIRFGNFKDSKAADFCLVGGAYYKKGKTFYLYYRAVELSLEFIFDIILLNQAFKDAEIKVGKLIVYSPRAFVSNRTGRLLYFHKLREMLFEGGM